MTRLSTAQVYALTQQAGFGPAGGVIMTAVTAAESGNRTDAIGDVDLTEPGEKSVGLTQINYRPSRDKASTVRDPRANLDPLTNMQHALVISGGGKRFTPWSTFTNGAYARAIPAARAAAGQPLVQVPSTVAGNSGTTGQQAGFGLDDLNPLTAPWKVGNWLWDHTAGSALGSAQKGIAEAAFKVAITVAVFGSGLALVVIGARETVAPAIQKQRDKAMQLAPLAAL